MKIVRHVARDMRQAMRAIRERLGEDAVILSSRRTSEGVELTAAVDFDAETLAGASIQPLADPAESPLIRREAGLTRDGGLSRDNAPAAATDWSPNRESSSAAATDWSSSRETSSATATNRSPGRESSGLDHASARDGARTDRQGARSGRDATLAMREAALNRRETPLIRDDDAPVHSKLPPSLDDLPTYEPTPAVQRLETDSPLISRELQ